MSLRDTILSERNIYSAIYALNSYISDIQLLSAEDLRIYTQLSDKFAFGGIIKDVISECQKLITTILDKDDLFEVSVFFKLKKFDEDKIEYRPLHSADLISQISMASMLIPLMFNDDGDKRKLSELSCMLPHNFYGNIPSERVDSLFCHWTNKYRQYTDIVNEKCREYNRTREYDKEICLDLIDFFPSINPKFIFSFIVEKLSACYQKEDVETLRNNDLETLKKVVVKLLYFRIADKNLCDWKDVYYRNTLKDELEGRFTNRGIAQGLPQSYFFGNLCMVVISEIMSKNEDLKDSDTYFYVDDSVVFARNLKEENFSELIASLNKSVNEELSNYKVSIDNYLSSDWVNAQLKIRYEINFHSNGKSTINDIKDSISGLENLFLVQRPVSIGGWFKGNVDEVDEHVSLKKLNALVKVVDNELKVTKKKSEVSSPDQLQSNQTRIKWLARYKKYFLYRQRKLEIMASGKFNEKNITKFYDRFSFGKIQNLSNDANSSQTLETLFNTFEEEIFKTEIDLLGKEMPISLFNDFAQHIKEFESSLSKYNKSYQPNKDFLYYHRFLDGFKTLQSLQFEDRYVSLTKLMSRATVYTKLETFLEEFNNKHDISENIFWNRLNDLNAKSDDNTFALPNVLPEWTRFIFQNSNEYRRMILNCYFSLVCKIQVSDMMNVLRSDIRPIPYYQFRILAMLRNYHLETEEFFDFLRPLDFEDLNERMDIDLGILEAINLFRQRIQDPLKIDKMILTHRVVKSLWHNGSKFLNTYTLHNQEHAIMLIKNVIRLVNNIDFLNLKSNDYFLLFQACYLHDVSMVVHPNVASFNESNPSAENIVSHWIHDIESFHRDIDDAFRSDSFSLEGIYLLRKNIGRALVTAFQEVFDFFENKVRSGHPHDSANFIRLWQQGILSFLSELEAETIALVSDSHGWDSTDVYSRKSKAKEELISLKYMMILIRIADLLDLANDRIDYYILKQNRSQMGLISRFHWISHLITDKFKIDVDYDSVDKYTSLCDQPIKETVHIDIFLNTDILSNISINKACCQHYNPSFQERKLSSHPDKKQTARCLEFAPSKDSSSCTIAKFTTDENGKKCCRCPFLCLWLTKKHEWLFNEVAELKHYLNAVNTELFSTDVVVRFFMTNPKKLDSEFYDDIKEWISKD